MVNKFLYFAFFALIFNFNACSSFFKNSTKLKQEQVHISENVPLKLEIDQAFIHNGNLNVDVKLTSKINIKTENIVLSIKGLEDNKVVEEKIKKVSDLVKKTDLEKNETIDVRLFLVSENISDYEVEVSWGEEAEKLLIKDKDVKTLKIESNNLDKEDSPSIKIINIEKRKLECDEDICDSLLTLNVKIENNFSSKIIKSITLASGLFWVNEGESLKDVLNIKEDTALNNEEKIVLDNLFIEPKKDKNIKIHINTPVPSIRGGELFPNVRMLEFFAE